MAYKVLKVLLIALGALIVLLGLAYVFREPLATRVTAFMLDRNGDMECTHPEVRIASSLQQITVTPFECQVFKPGPLKGFKADSDMLIELDGMEVTHIRIARATMEQHDRKLPDVRSNTLGDLSNLAGVRDGLLKGMLDASESYSPGGPVMEVGTLVAKRDGKVESIMKDFRRSFEDGWERQHAARMEGGAPGGIAMRDFDMRVTKSRGKLSLAVYLGKPERGEDPDVELKMDARGLNEKSPYVSLSM
jgi:hypothetical protein